MVKLVVGLICFFEAKQAFGKRRSILRMVLWLSFGAAFTALGLLDLMGFMVSEWSRVSDVAVVGLSLILASLSALSAPPSTSFPRLTQWAMLVFGLGCILFAVLEARVYYWR